MSKLPLAMTLALCALSLVPTPAVCAEPNGVRTVAKLSNLTGQPATDLHFDLVGARFTRVEGLSPGMKEVGKAAGSQQAGFNGFQAAAGDELLAQFNYVISSNEKLDLTYYWTRDGQPILYDKPGSKTQYFRVPKLEVQNSSLGSGLNWEYQNPSADEDFALTELSYATVSQMFDLRNETPTNLVSMLNRTLAPGQGSGVLFTALNPLTETLYVAGTATSSLGSRFEFRSLIGAVPEPASLSMVGLLLALLFMVRRFAHAPSRPPPAPSPACP